MPADEIPETRFATLGDDRIAYQVFGKGDVDLLYVSATGDPIELRWDWPAYASFLRRLGSLARVITFDRRGSGSSDQPSGQALASWEYWPTTRAQSWMRLRPSAQSSSDPPTAARSRSSLPRPIRAGRAD